MGRLISMKYVRENALDAKGGVWFDSSFVTFCPLSLIFNPVQQKQF